MIVSSSLPHCPAFAGVRVEPADREPWLVDAEANPQIVRRDTRRRDDPLCRERSRHIGKRYVDGHRDRAQFGTGQHHDRHVVAAGGLAGQVGQIFGMTGKAEACVVEGFLGDRTRHERCGYARKRVGGAAVDGFDHAGRICRVGMARRVDEGRPQGHDRQPGRECCGSIGRRRFGKRHMQSKAARAGGEQVGIAEQIEGGQCHLLSQQPGGDGDFGTDPGGIPDRHGERALIAGGTHLQRRVSA